MSITIPHHPTTYIGDRHPGVDVTVVVRTCQLTAHGQPYDIRFRPLHHIPFHSPTGFEWGFAGSGPRDLALAILADYLGEPQSVSSISRTGPGRAWDLHGDLAREVISRLPTAGWQLTGWDLERWLAAHVRAEAVP